MSKNCNIRTHTKHRLFCAILTTIIALCMLYVAPTATGATDVVASGDCGANGSNVTWTLNTGGTLNISGSGAMKNYRITSEQTTDSPWFSLRSSIMEISISNGVSVIGTWAFGYCDKATTVKMANSVTKIEDYAFDGCENIIHIEIPNSVVTIGKGVFFDCNSLTSINIPKSVTSIGNLSFSSIRGVSKITNVFVARDNTSYSSVNGRLLNKNKTKFIYYPAGNTDENYKIPNGVVSIGEYAFSNCFNLKSIEIPKSVKQIEEGAFFFYPEGQLTDIYYAGAQQEWETIQISDYNDTLHSATIHYNSTGQNDEPIVNLDELMKTDSTLYNNELAEVAAMLSLKSYDDDCKSGDSVEGYLQYNLGFDKTNIHSRNYGKDYAFTIATKEYSGDDADEILVVVAQGTTNISESIKDYVSGIDYDNKDFYGGYAPYQVVSAFYSEIVSHDYKNTTNLYSLTKQNKRYKILVTGHSLGGAVANLLSAQLTARRHIGAAIGQSDVFCYTFGAIDVIRTDSPVVEGYKNIHNIYNELDTLSPTQHGRSFIGKNGIFLRNGKFGVIESFEHEFRTPYEKSHGDQVLAAVNHAMHNYLEAVKSGIVKDSPLRPGNAGVLDLANSYSVVGCPVNIDVYCEGNLLGRVVNNTVDTSVTGVNIFVDDDVKFIVYPDNRQYDLMFSAFDEGSMVYYTQGLSGKMLVKTIANVKLTKGKQMTSQVGGDIDVSDIKLFVVREDGVPVLEVTEDGTEVPVEHTVTVIDGVAHPNKASAGDIVTITADTKSGFIFKGWNVESGDFVLDDDAEPTTTFIMPSEDVVITATYARKSNLLVILIAFITANVIAGLIYLIIFLLRRRKKRSKYYNA